MPVVVAVFTIWWGWSALLRDFRFAGMSVTGGGFSNTSLYEKVFLALNNNNILTNLSYIACGTSKIHKIV